MVEVLDHAPAALTPRERWALVALAEDANDMTRVCSKGVESNEKVMRRFRAGLSGRKEILKALVDKGAIARVKRGQKHQHAEFMILPLAPAQQPGNPDPENGLSGRETRTLNDPQQPDSPVSAAGFPGLRGRKTRPPSPHSPQDPSSPRARAVQIVTASTGATEEEAEEVVRTIKAKRDVKSWPGFLRTMAERGDLDAMLAEIRGRNSRAGMGAWLAWLQTQPQCPHGNPGGDQRRPDNNLQQCPQCRGVGGRRPVTANGRGLEAWS